MDTPVEANRGAITIGMLAVVLPPRSGNTKCGTVRGWSPYTPENTPRSCSERAVRDGLWPIRAAELGGVDELRIQGGTTKHE